MLTHMQVRFNLHKLTHANSYLSQLHIHTVIHAKLHVSLPDPCTVSVQLYHHA